MSIRISRHFQENWRARVGGDPDPQQICEILGRSLRVQTGGAPIGGSLYTKTLSIYWSPSDGVLIKMDPTNGTLVTVLSAAMQEGAAA
ncbi:hypothetical protein [Mycolicibacterium sp.]|uniref:hypothetical protein n=1 Tax=Mycolicibacterium sp. TaxID=2320850 RepID=UPI00355E4B75